MAKRAEGKGLKILSTTTWYGPGYCGICGDPEHITPQAVRWWDPDDGWKTGVLCSYCADDAKDRGPQPDDYAYKGKRDSDIIDAMRDTLGNDLDGLQADLEDLGVTRK